MYPVIRNTAQTKTTHCRWLRPTEEYRFKIIRLLALQGPHLQVRTTLVQICASIGSQQPVMPTLRPGVVAFQDVVEFTNRTLDARLKPMLVITSASETGTCQTVLPAPGAATP